MKCKRCILFFIMFVVFCLVATIYFPKASISMESQLKEPSYAFLNTINLRNTTALPSKKPISCFDVNENGEIAIGFDGLYRQQVCVLSNDGSFKRGYSFKSNGSFSIGYNKDSLHVYLFRDNKIVTFDSSGKVQGIREVINESEKDYWTRRAYLSKRSIDDKEYTLKNDMGLLNIFAQSYSQLELSELDGKKSLLYDVNKFYFSHMLIIVICVLTFVSLTVAGVIKEFVKARHNILLKSNHDI